MGPLLPQFCSIVNERPSIVPFRGGLVHIWIHDLWYLQKRKGWLRRVKAEHPDIKRREPGAYLFRKMRRTYRTWECDQDFWYAEFDLTKPKVRDGRRVQL